MPVSPETIADRVALVRERIERAARHAGRDSASVTLVAVTKTHPPALIEQVLATGVVDLGENRVQEAASKVETLRQTGHKVRWHLIGHLQRNKARVAVGLFDVVHSVDSLRLAEALDRQVREAALSAERAPDSRLPILLQINVSGEASKEGFALPSGCTNKPGLEALLGAIERIVALPGLEVRGLMTIAPLVEDPELARPTFRMLRELREELARQVPTVHWNELSMGMTDDFEVAISEGATLVRVGRALFGER